MISYVVSVRGAIPPALARRIAEAQALAIQKRLTNAVNVPAGKKVRHSVKAIRRALCLF